VTAKPPLVVAVEMGFGHLRAADAVARALGRPLLHADREPIADPEERALWAGVRRNYERLSRLATLPAVGRPFSRLLETITRIPELHPARDLSRPTLATGLIERLVGRGIGRGVLAALDREQAPLFTTFFATAIAADRKGAGDVDCLVTDTDLARAWVARDPGRSRIRYFAPSERAVRRLAAYGVPRERIVMTGFPLPGELLGGEELPVARRHLARRLGRLDPRGRFKRALGAEAERRLGASLAADGESPLVVFAVGGAGAQAGLAARILPSLRPLIEVGRLRLALLAGTRPAVRRHFEELLARHDLSENPGVRVVSAPDVDAYFPICNALLAEADVLWTKPSEMTFFAALGLPLVLSSPVGTQEIYNRRWAVESGAGLEQRDPRFAGEWLGEWLEDGALAGAAWNGFTRLPKRGLYRILSAFEERGGVASATSATSDRGGARSPAIPAASSIATRSTGS
jgi:hypothetical protein